MTLIANMITIMFIINDSANPIFRQIPLVLTLFKNSVTRYAIQMSDTNTTQESKYKLARVLYIAGGFLALGLGTLGMFVPVLPTVPFYLVTAFCFAKGSKRYEKWFKNTRLFKKRVYFFDKYRVMTLQSQLSILIFVSGIMVFTCLSVDKPVVSIVLPTCSAIQYLYFIFKIKLVTKAEIETLKAAEGLS